MGAGTGMSPGDFLLWLGIKVPDLLAGFFGGVVHAFVFQRSKPAEAVASVVVGALTANYISESAQYYFKGLALNGGGVSFVVGLTAMAICQGIMSAVRSRIPKGGSGNA